MSVLVALGLVQGAGLGRLEVVRWSDGGGRGGWRKGAVLDVTDTHLRLVKRVPRWKGRSGRGRGNGDLRGMLRRCPCLPLPPVPLPLVVWRKAGLLC